MPIRWKMKDAVCDAYEALDCTTSAIHGHHHFLLTLITRGKGIQIINGVEIPFEAGDLFILSPADFTEDLYRRVAEMVWQQLETGLVNPGGIVNHFINDGDEYKEVAALFNTKLRAGMTKDEQEKAFEETVLRVKRHSLDEASRRATDVMALQEIIKQQAALRDLHISFD